MKETFYELGYLLVPTISESEVTEMRGKIKQAIATVGATAKTEGDVHFIDLAYEMVKKVKSKNIKFDQAHFGWIKFTAEGAQSALLEKELKKHPEVLRTIVIKTEEDDAVTDLFISEEVSEEVEAETDVNEGVDMGEKKEESVDAEKETEKEEKTEEDKVEEDKDAEEAPEESDEKKDDSEETTEEKK